jgi:hypothetical protein
MSRGSGGCIAGNVETTRRAGAMWVPKISGLGGLLVRAAPDDLQRCISECASTRCLQHELAVFFQQPGGGDTPGVAAAPVALAGAIIVGLARFIEMASLHAAEFGVGIAVMAGLTLVLPRSAIGD